MMTPARPLAPALFKRFSTLRTIAAGLLTPAMLVIATLPAYPGQEYIFTRPSSGYGWTQGGSYHDSSGTPLSGSPGAEDDLVLKGDGTTIGTLNASGDREVHHLSSVVDGALLGGGTSPSSLVVWDGITIDTAGASLALRNGTSSNLLDVTVKDSVNIAQGALYIGASSGALGLKSFLVEGTTTVSSALYIHRNNATGISLGHLAVHSAGTVILLSASGTNDGTLTSTIGATSLSGSGTITGSDMNGTGIRTGTLEVSTAGATDASFDGVLEDGSTGATLHLAIKGPGRQTLTGVNTYTGTTTLSGSTLVLADGTVTAGAINSSAGILLEEGATLLQNSSTSLTAAITLTHGTVGGSGTIVGDLSVGANATLSPGNSPGQQTFEGNQTWNAGGNYNWQIHDASAAAGIGYDTVTLTGTLDLSSLAPGSTFNLNLWSLSGTDPDNDGDALNFDLNHSYSWLIASADAIVYDAGLYGIDELFTLNLGAFNGTAGFQNAYEGEWFVSLGQDGKSLHLNYAAVPEPGSLLLFSGALGGLLLLLRRRRAAA